MRLKTSEVREYRLKTLEEQGYHCALCGEPLEAAEAVLDHDHKSGYVRGVLHRGCNALEGKIANSLAMNKISAERLQSILNNYIFYTNQHHTVLHPTHRTPEEKRLRAKKRRSRATKRRTTANR